jgi:hypothetical protein
MPERRLDLGGRPRTATKVDGCHPAVTIVGDMSST